MRMKKMVDFSMDKRKYNSSDNYYTVSGDRVVRLNHSSKEWTFTKEFNKYFVSSVFIVGLVTIPLALNPSIVGSDNLLLQVLLFILGFCSFNGILVFSTMMIILRNSISLEADVLTEINGEEYKTVEKYTPENLSLLHTALDEKEIYPEETHDAIDSAINAIIKKSQDKKEENNKLEIEKEKIVKEIVKENNYDTYDTIIDSWNEATRKINLE